ncbi:hypothetical protein AHAS_Ahas11G0101700 [Arachis hypogaea]
MDPRAGGVPVDAPVRGHVAAPARQQGPNVPDNRRRATRARVGTRYNQPVGARHEGAIGMDDDPEHHDHDGGGGGDDGDDGGDDDGWGGGGGGGSGWGGGASGSGWGGGDGGGSWGGGASGSGWGGGSGGGGSGEGGGSARGGGSTSRGHITGHQVDADVVGVEGTLFQADAATLFSDFGSSNQMEQVFGAGSEFFADFAQFGSPAGDYRPQFDGVAVDLNVDLNKVPTGYQGGEFALGGTPASAFGRLRQHPPPVEPEPADAADSMPPDAFVPVTQRRKRVIKPAKCGIGSHMC